MGEVKRYDPNYAAMSPADDLAVEAEDGMFVMATDYATLEAELAKLRAELERLVPDGCLIVPIQPTEEMRKLAQDYLAAEGMIVSDWLVHTAYTEMLAAAPSAPKADPAPHKTDRQIKAERRAAIEAMECPKADPVRASLSADNQRITPPDPIIAKPHPLAEISKADPVKVQLLEALEEIMYAEIHSPISMNNAGCVKKMQGIARAAIAAARKEEIE